MAKIPAGAVDREIGERLRTLRKARGMSMAELGAALRLSSQQVQKYEAGQNRISVAILGAFAQALGVTLCQLSAGTSAGASCPSDASQAALWLAPEEFKLLTAFAQIGDAKLRKQLLALTVAMGGMQTERGPARNIGRGRDAWAPACALAPDAHMANAQTVNSPGGDERS